jgi:hypothetical protein
VNKSARRLTVTKIQGNERQEWNIHLASWVIQDGNYADFAKGQTAEFAVECHVPAGSSIAECDGEPVAAQSGFNYDAIGTCVVQNVAITLLNIGILVYRQGGRSVCSLRGA